MKRPTIRTSSIINKKKNTPFKYVPYEIIFNGHKIDFKECEKGKEDLIFYRNVPDVEEHVYLRIIKKLCVNSYNIARKFLRNELVKMDKKEKHKFLKDVIMDLMYEQGYISEEE